MITTPVDHYKLIVAGTKDIQHVGVDELEASPQLLRGSEIAKVWAILSKSTGYTFGVQNKVNRC